VKAIVTVKLYRPSVKHNPRRKLSGRCPIQSVLCTDITGSHHSYIETGETLKEIKVKAITKWGHVTRVEVMDE